MDGAVVERHGRPPNGLRLSGRRKPVRCSRGLGAPSLVSNNAHLTRPVIPTESNDEPFAINPDKTTLRPEPVNQIPVPPHIRPRYRSEKLEDFAPALIHENPASDKIVRHPEPRWPVSIGGLVMVPGSCVKPLP